MGAVFAGTHTLTGRRVAIKLLHPNYATDKVVGRRFFQEARAATTLDHPNVVQVLDMGHHDEHTVYLVLELLKGETLGARLDRAGAVPHHELLAIIDPVLRAL